MKKTFIALMTLAAAVTACNKAEIIETNPGEVITFGNAFVENATKATDPTYGAVALKAFNVYGKVSGTIDGSGTVNIFNGDEVTGSVGSNVWSCSNTQYWIPTANYNFAAVVDATVASKDSYNMPLTLTTTANTDGSLKDMLYATATVTNAAADQAPVNFSFNHLLSKAHFTVTSNTEGGYSHTVKDIKVSNFTTGTYTISSDNWAGSNAKDIEFGAVEGVTNASGAKTNTTEMLLIPNTATFNVTFTVDLYKNDTKLGTETKTISVDTDLVKGNAYNFTIACSVGNPIKFTVANDPTWSTQPNVTIQ